MTGIDKSAAKKLPTNPLSTDATGGSQSPPRKGSLADFLLNSPLRGSGIVIERDRREMREIDFGLDDEEANEGEAEQEKE